MDVLEITDFLIITYIIEIATMSVVDCFTKLQSLVINLLLDFSSLVVDCSSL